MEIPSVIFQSTQILQMIRFSPIRRSRWALRALTAMQVIFRGRIMDLSRDFKTPPELPLRELKLHGK